MEAFFKKYPPDLEESYAVKMIHKKIECAEHELNEDEESEDYMKYLAHAYEMLESFFDEKGVDPNTLT